MDLLTKTWIEANFEQLEPWQLRAFRDFSHMLNSRTHPYPCIPAKHGFKQDSLRFGFVQSPHSSNASKQTAEHLRKYGKISKDTGKYTSLVLFFNTENLQLNVEQYQDLFWTILNNLHSQDDASWPSAIPLSPEDQSWEFCFDGEPYFVFCATPSHSQRRSRYFPYFLLALQPRFVFDEINSETTQGQKLKDLIRSRLRNYDDIPVHPDLKWYGDQDNHEWKQYFLNDDQKSLKKCPFANKFKYPRNTN